MSSGRNGTAQQYRPHVLKYKRLISGNLTLAQDSAEEKAIVSAPEFGAAAPSKFFAIAWAEPRFHPYASTARAP